MSEDWKSRKQPRKDDYCKKTQTLDIPYHLLMEEILPRLPVKSLLRFKCVCKNWLHTISSDCFVKSHLRLSSSPSYQVMMFAASTRGYYQRKSLCFLNYDPISNQKQLFELDFDTVSGFGNHKFDIVGCSNGLVCLGDLFDGLFRIWNPATRAYRDIVKPEGYRVCTTRGFGYVSSIDDYRIVSYFISNTDYDDFQLHVFSSTTDAWKRVFPFHNHRDIQYCRLGAAVWLGNNLFWLLRKRNRTSKFNNATSIISFDQVSEQLTEIPWRMDSDDMYHDMDLCVINGYLSLSCHRSSHLSNCPAADFWMLTQPGVWNSWQKLFSLERGMDLVTVFDNGKCLVEYSNTERKKGCWVSRLSVIDLTQGATKKSQSSIDINPYFVKTRMKWNYVESLVSPFGTPNSH